MFNKYFICAFLLTSHIFASEKKEGNTTEEKKTINPSVLEAPLLRIVNTSTSIEDDLRALFNNYVSKCYKSNNYNLKQTEKELFEFTNSFIKKHAVSEDKINKIRNQAYESLYLLLFFNK